LLSGGSYTTLDVPGSSLTAAFGINDFGQSVGSFVANGVRHGFLYNVEDGSYIAIDPPGSPSTIARGIDDSGQIVGEYGQVPDTNGFLLSEGSYTTFDPPGGLDSTAKGMSATTGLIVGDYVDAGGARHGYLATPIPERSTIMVFGIGTLSLIG
jgi:hypothetical protein